MTNLVLEIKFNEKKIDVLQEKEIREDTTVISTLLNIEEGHHLLPQTPRDISGKRNINMIEMIENTKVHIEAGDVPDHVHRLDKRIEDALDLGHHLGIEGDDRDRGHLKDIVDGAVLAIDDFHFDYRFIIILTN